MTNKLGDSIASKLLVLFTILIVGVSSQNTFAQLGSIKSKIKKIKKKKKPERKQGDKASDNKEGSSFKASDLRNKKTLRKMPGRLVFSKQPIDPSNPTNLSSEFNTGDYIYGLLILDKPLREYINYPKKYPGEDTQYYLRVNRPYLRIDVMVDGQPLFGGTHNIVFSKDQKEGSLEKVPMDTYFFFDIAPEASKQRTYKYKDLHFPVLSVPFSNNKKFKAGPAFMSQQLGIRAPGKHTLQIKIEVQIYQNPKDDDSISGEIVVSGEDFSFYKKVASDLENVAGATTTFPKSKWKNLRVEQSIKTAYRKAGIKGKIIRFAFKGMGWTNQRNSLGLIEYRSIFAYLGLKHRNGSCEIVNYAFQQNHLGRNRFGATRVRGEYTSSESQKVPCSVLTK